MHNKRARQTRDNIEKNARHLQLGGLPYDTYPRIVMDLSFISLTKVLPPVWRFLEANGYLIALVKPHLKLKSTKSTLGVVS